MAPAKRNRVVIIYDLANENKDVFRAALIKISTEKFLNRCKDNVHFILANSSKTDNFLNDQMSGYEHIAIVGTIEEPLEFEPDLVKLTYAKPAQGNWLEAINVALELLYNTSKTDNFKYVYNYQILFLTDLSTPILKETVNPIQITKSLSTLNAYLYIVGPDVNFTEPLIDIQKIPQYMENIQWNNKNTINNFNYVQQMIQLNNNITLADFKIGIQLFNVYLRDRERQGWKVPLKVGGVFEIPTISWRYCHPVYSLKLNGEDVTGVTKNKWGEYFNNTKLVLEEDMGIEVKPEDIIRGYCFHEIFIPVPDKSTFKEKTLKDFRIVYFSLKSEIPEVYLQGPYRMLTKAEDSAKEGFEALISILLSKDLCAIARRIYSNNTRPMFLILIPEIRESGPCFFGIEVPFEHEMNIKKSAVMEDLNLNKIKTVTIDPKIENYLDSITLENNCTNVSVHPKLIASPRNNLVVNAYADAHFGKELNLEQFDVDFTRGAECDVKLKEEISGTYECKKDVDSKNEGESSSSNQNVKENKNERKMELLDEDDAALNTQELEDFF